MDDRAHVLSDSLLAPRLVLPYLRRCAAEAAAMEDERAARGRAGAALAQGLASSLRTLVIATFRAPATR
jgi:hypothetical protein